MLGNSERVGVNSDRSAGTEPHSLELDVAQSGSVEDENETNCPDGDNGHR